MSDWMWWVEQAANIVGLALWWNIALGSVRWLRDETPTRVFAPWLLLGCAAFIAADMVEMAARDSRIGPKPGVWYCVDAECCVEAKVREDGGMAFHQDASNCGGR